MTDSNTAPTNFIHQIVEADVAANTHGGSVVTRFPPEPNGYLHIGHAKSICLNFGIAYEFNGKCFLRFDDTNPDKESSEYVESIKADVQWLGFDFGDHLTHASDYFDQLYAWAIELIENGKAYVCSLTAEEIRATRGTLTEPGTPSPYRDRNAAENLDLFARMRSGEFPDGAHVLRAKIDIAAPNMNLRDPTLYRIRHQNHQNTGDCWCIYPMYDFTHPLSDAIEGVTHSLCTLEFEDHRPLYDWVLDNVSVPCYPRQIEFSRLALDYTVLSKRLLTTLVTDGHVTGWDDPRMPTLSGMRRRGYTPASIRTFCARIGITRKEQQIELTALESCIREDLERSAPRRLGVLHPLKLVIENYPDQQSEEFSAPNHPADPAMGKRTVPFCREILIEQSDFMEDPSARFFGLAPGREVRLRYAYYVTCTGVAKDKSGSITELRCRYDPDSRGGGTADGRKVKGTLHWVSAKHSVTALIRLYSTLFTVTDLRANPNIDSHNLLNSESLITLNTARVEPLVVEHSVGDKLQLERLGYFCMDPESTIEQPVLNRTVALRDSRPTKRAV
jgi:glutaminyl-tRNA synthetase